MKKKSNDKTEKVELPNDFTQLIGDITLYKKLFIEYEIKLKSFSLSLHGNTVHKWCNKPYSAKFWDVHGDLKGFFNYYTKKLQSLKTVLLVANIQGTSIAFIEVYHSLSREISEYLPTGELGYGLRLLMAPHRDLILSIGKQAKGLSANVLCTVLYHLFYNCQVDYVIAEPEKTNTLACRLAQKLGFDFVKDVQLSNKWVSLYRYDKNKFYRDFPNNDSGKGTSVSKVEG